MTSNTPQNMDSIARPTSRVLAPPGGSTSNIFGTDPEPIKGNRNFYHEISKYFFKNSIRKILGIKPMIFSERVTSEKLKKPKFEKMKKLFPKKQNRSQPP